MKINQQELDDAIEIISEGGEALGVSCDDVYERMVSNKVLVKMILEDLHKNLDIRVAFIRSFEILANDMLLEDLRAKMENDNGL